MTGQVAVSGVERRPGELVDIALDGGWWEAEVAYDDGEVTIIFAGAEQSAAREAVRTRVQWQGEAGGAAAGHWEAVLAPPDGGHAACHLWACDTTTLTLYASTSLPVSR